MRGPYSELEFEIQRVRKRDYAESIATCEGPNTYNEYKSWFFNYSLNNYYYMRRTLTKREMYFGKAAEPIYLYHENVPRFGWVWEKPVYPNKRGTYVWKERRQYFEGM